MTLRHLALRSLLHHWRLHLGVLSGTAVAAVVLTGALLVGASVDASLQARADARLGAVAYALEAAPRFVDAALARLIEDRLGAPVVPTLGVRAVALRRGEDGRVAAATGVTLHGVDSRLAQLAPVPGEVTTPGAGEALVNRRVAEALGAEPGAMISLRIERVAAMPLDAPLSDRSARLTRLGSFDVAGILPPEQLGDLNLRAEQIPPANVFVELEWLQDALDRPGAANLLLASGAHEPALLDQAFAEVFDLGLAGYQLREVPDAGVVQLEAERIFLEPAAARAALSLPDANGSLTWLVDSISSETGRTPYSFLVATGPGPDAAGPVPAGVQDDEIVLNAWTAEQLDASPGDTVELAWSVPTASGGFEPMSRDFRVHSVASMEAIAGERAAVPGFPGLTDADRCGDWDIGMPLDSEKLRDPANERYWSEWRQTPKAFVTLAAGRGMAATRWGELTAVRYPAGPSAPTLDGIEVDPAELGFVFQPVAHQAVRALAGAIDFGGLFLGMSFFIIAAALALTAMLQAFTLRHRSEELGTYRALGFSSRQVAAILLAEAGLITAAGAGVGALGGSLYTRAMLLGLGGAWQSAVAGMEIAYAGSTAALVGGAVATFLSAFAAVGLTLWFQLRREVRQLHAATASDDEGPRSGRIAQGLTVGFAATAGVAILGPGGIASVSSSFFFAGTLILLASLSALWWFLLRWGRPSGGRLGLGRLALRNAARRRWRSLGAAGIFACGCFIVVTVSSMGSSLSDSVGPRWSGTGGFHHYAETVLPVPIDALSEPSGGIIPLRIREGDDASCFNLNRARAPRLLGVDPAGLRSRGAFEPPEREASVWELLKLELPEGVIPGLAGDQDTALWNLALTADPEQGDEIAYLDEEGRELRVRLVGSLPVRKSILQGSVLISERAFTSSFPSQVGYRAFLLDGGGAEREGLEERFADQGMDLQATPERLRGFYAVEHGYLAMFALLGGLGIVLGSLGMGVVLLGSLTERRGEHALLSALGFSRGTIGRLVLMEHAGLFAAGIASGTGAALLATAPLLRKPGAGSSMLGPLIIVGCVLLVGLGWIALTGALGRRRATLEGLRRE
jgi:putative ABC transport system permease protein